MKAAAIAGFLLIAVFSAAASAAAPSFSKVKSSHASSEALVLDRELEVIHEMRIDPIGRRLDWLSLGDIPPSLKNAVLESEDKRFYRHRGVDWRALASAAVGNLFSSHPRGASTITMQLVSILNRRSGSAHRSWREKWEQIRSARELERSWSKEEIIEAYFNLVSFRGELQGVGAAARALFGKEPHGLSDIESVVLAALIRSPNAAIDKLTSRACALGRSMSLRDGCEDVSARVSEALSRPPVIRARVELAPHVAVSLLEPFRRAKDNKNLSVVSTLDGRLQRFAVDVLREQLLILRSQNVRDGALLIVENKTGEVLAYVGSGGELASARYVDGVKAPRQAGSTLKPFLYGLAFERRLLTPATLLDDSATDISVRGGVYRPRNYDERFRGPVDARTALASSLNVPAVRTLSLVGIEVFLRRLRDLGFSNLSQDDDYYGPALALGSADVSLWTLVNAYRTLANGGEWSELKLTAENQPPSRRVFSEESSFLVSSILSDRESRSLTFGLEGPLATRFWTAVKTGTSKDMRDNWCIGFSIRYTVGVWVGNFTGEPMWNVSGMSGAAPVWLEVMNRLHRNEPSRPRKAPPGILEKAVEDPLRREQRAEWFVRGTEPVSQRLPARRVHYKIVYPVEGTVMALDPDIPRQLQKIFFEAKPGHSRIRWVLNGSAIGHAGSAVSWTPQAGKHTLALMDEEEQVLDRVTFSVRGRIESEEERIPPSQAEAALK